MKTIGTYITEKFRLRDDTKLKEKLKPEPENWDELRRIIEDRYDELGPGTEQKPIDFNDIDINKIITFNDEIGLFQNTKFEYINISNWDVLNVKDMGYMFYGCLNLKSIGDISNWNISNVENMFAMFYECKQLKSLDLSDWDVSKIENMEYMFYNCKQLESIGNLSDWNVSKVKDLSLMFYNCKNLKTVGNLSNWIVSGVKYHMFEKSAITNVPNWYEG